MKYLILCVLTVVSVIQIHLAVGSCINSKYTLVTNHTGCISKSSFARHLGDMTSAIKDEIVSIHNHHRAGINATNMQKMVWDEELAVLSQMWADNCEFKHDSGKRAIPGRFTVGQNLGLGHQSWSAVLNSWWDEIRDFSYDNRANMIFSRVGHFTQMAWAESAKVGCGWATCTNPEMSRYSGGRYYVCNYGAAGNNPWWTPYKVTNEQNDSRRCSSCPGSCDANGLCDCGGKVCQNGGRLDVNTCQCTCAKLFHVGDTCGLDCEQAQDSRHCGVFWVPAHCHQYTNVPAECPHMCGLCPLADYRSQASNVTSEVVPVPSPPPTPSVTQSTTRRTTTARAQTTPLEVTPPAVVPSNVTATPTNTTKETTDKSIDIKIEQKNGKTLISIPNKTVLLGNDTASNNGSVRVVKQPTSGLYSTLVLILRLL